MLSLLSSGIRKASCYSSRIQGWLSRTFNECFVMGWVHEAMGKIFGVLLPYWDSYLLVLGVASVIAL